MGELIDSDDWMNEADHEGFSQDSSFSYENDSSDEEEPVSTKCKDKAKINNSFTGPYPLDPSDFKHNDKGPNY